MAIAARKVACLAFASVTILLAGISGALAQSAGPATPREQVAALPADDTPTVTLPEVDVFGFYPGANARQGPRASSSNTVRTQHFRVWSGYDSQLAMHPYTSHLGPCPEGHIGSGCNRTSGTLIPPSRYERQPFTN